MQVSRQTYRSTRKNFHENLKNELWSMQYEIYCQIISTFFYTYSATGGKIEDSRSRMTEYYGRFFHLHLILFPCELHVWGGARTNYSTYPIYRRVGSVLI